MAGIKRGDTVVVISGKDRGSRGKVLRVIADKGRLVVEGVNKQKHHQKPTQKIMQGGIITKEGAIDASNVMLYCTHCHQPVKVKRQMREDGHSQRLCANCDTVLD